MMRAFGARCEGALCAVPVFLIISLHVTQLFTTDFNYTVSTITAFNYGLRLYYRF
jgi:hypothetical protein